MARHANVNRASIHPFLFGAFVWPDSLVAVFTGLGTSQHTQKQSALRRSRRVKERCQTKYGSLAGHWEDRVRSERFVGCWSSSIAVYGLATTPPSLGMTTTKSGASDAMRCASDTDARPRESCHRCRDFPR